MWYLYTLTQDLEVFFTHWCCFVCCQAAQTVLISLFELNTPEFTMLLGALPKTFQDGATKLLHNHLKNSSVSTAAVHNLHNKHWSETRSAHH